MTKRRILWMKGGALGDFILALPVLSALRAAYPHAWIDATGPKVWLPLATGWADSLVPLELPCWSSLFGDGAGLPDSLETSDLAVVLRPDTQGILKKNLLAAGVRQVLVHSPVPAPRTHQVDHLREILVPLGIPSDPWPKVLHPLERSSKVGKDARIFIQVGSGGVHKQWPAENFLEVGEWLRGRGEKVSILLGPVEIERGEHAFWRDRGADVIESPPIWTLAGWLRNARLFVGNDSGAGHLAAAVSCPTLVLFGPTDPAVWAPRGPRVRIVSAREERPVSDHARAPSMRDIRVETVLNAIEAFLEDLD